MNSVATDPQKSATRWFFMICLILSELTLISAEAPQARLFVYSLVNLPLVKITAFLTCVGVFVFVLSERKALLPSKQLSLTNLSLHLFCSGVLLLTLEPTLAFTLTHSIWASGPIWLFLALSFLGSWMQCLMTAGQWLGLARAKGKHLLGAFFLATLVPYLVDLAERAWVGNMVRASFELGRLMLSLIFDEIIVRPEDLVLGVPSFQIFVHHSCSGYEGIGLIGIFLSLYIYLRKDALSFPGALLILPLGMAASWFANSARLAALITVGGLLSPRIALGAFHSNAGWVSFVLLSLFFLFVLEKYRLFHKEPAECSPIEAASEEFVNPSIPYLLPLVLQLALTLLFSSFTEGLDLLYPARVVIVGAVLLSFHHLYSERGLYESPRFLAVLIGLAVYVLWIALIPESSVLDPRGNLSASLAVVWLLSRLLGSVLIVPIIEELAFRGYLLRRLQSVEFEEVPQERLTLVSVALSSLAFGLLHSEWFPGLIAGIFYALACKIRGKLSDCIVAHATTNLCIAVHVVVFDRWDLWI